MAEAAAAATAGPGTAGGPQASFQTTLLSGPIVSPQSWSGPKLNRLPSLGIPAIQPATVPWSRAPGSLTGTTRKVTYMPV